MSPLCPSLGQVSLAYGSYERECPGKRTGVSLQFSEADSIGRDWSACLPFFLSHDFGERVLLYKPKSCGIDGDMLGEHCVLERSFCLCRAVALGSGDSQAGGNLALSPAFLAGWGFMVYFSTLLLGTQPFLFYKIRGRSDNLNLSWLCFRIFPRFLEML